MVQSDIAKKAGRSLPASGLRAFEFAGSYFKLNEMS
jgi:hypothetical protein